MDTNAINYSVLMSVYYKDNKDWLIESIESMMNQTIKTNDFVIVKDGKLNEELNFVISEYCKKYSDIFNIIELSENIGLGPALAIGVKQCKNEYIARMDSDDISRKDRIEKELKIIQEYNLDMVGSNIAEFTGDIKNIRAYRVLPEKHNEIIKFAKKRNPFGHPSMLLRKSKILEAGNYRTYYLCEDYDMWIRLFNVNAKAYNIQENLVYMRVSDDFYKRRGGIKYLKSILKFKTEQVKNGFFSKKDYIISSSASIITCLMPNFIREIIYKKILRKKGN
ncbi:MAG: glycosyltransferase [Clostridia bacterium]|nr:glycosyltransferase [Clostridia bacterium]